MGESLSHLDDLLEAPDVRCSILSSTFYAICNGVKFK